MRRAATERRNMNKIVLSKEVEKWESLKRRLDSIYGVESELDDLKVIITRKIKV